MPRRHEGAKKKEKRTGKCFLCGSTENLTREHVVPANLFKDPKPTNLITLPTCNACNSSYSLDEEYFRVFVATEGWNNQTGRWIWDNKVIGSTLKRSHGLHTTLLDNIIPIDVFSKDGIYLGTQEGIPYNDKRINRVIEKICRGLFAFHHPEIDSMNLIYEINRIKITDNLPIVLAPLKREGLGDDTFIYLRGINEFETCFSIWVFLFYLKTCFSIKTKKKN